ncbi:antitoxin ParD1/3/4 [Singulisphaera sp. GP187]|uniref:type II toxin-antitoxin system ParD family antitoxin n=1 Tax=Singulisphaera sp. GP187 TaxID=1882752 RepID=UPI00092C03BE|nr:type II toxin-antitoxin system ParD family antitoxin [Singulisphaera sp. GP187]SIO46386.1 antitoxin ParD1/3/4 [Singulisphaera sp. GP187]
MPTRNINLTDHFDQFVEEQVEAGKYKNASEVLRAGLRLLEQRSQTEEQKLILLKKLATEGFAALDQGRGLALSGDEQLADAIGRIGRRAAKTSSSPSAE